MISQFIRKRNVNTALPFNKNFTRVQVSVNSKTFKTVKTAVTQLGTSRLLAETGNFITAETGNRLALD